MAYSDEEKKEIVDRICNIISEQGESLRSALNYNDMPGRTTFFEWLKDNDSFQNQYARACEERADSIFEEITKIADENKFDVRIDDEGKYTIDGEVVQRSRLKIDARKWVLSKMNPKKYGDKLEIETKDNVFTPEERTARINEILEKAKKRDL